METLPALTSVLSFWCLDCLRAISGPLYSQEGNWTKIRCFYTEVGELEMTVWLSPRRLMSRHPGSFTGEGQSEEYSYRLCEQYSTALPRYSSASPKPSSKHGFMSSQSGSSAMQIQHKPGSGLTTEIRYIQRDTTVFSDMICNEMEMAREMKTVACGINVEEKTVCATARWQQGQERYPHRMGYRLGQIHKTDPEAKEEPVEV